MNNKSLKYKYLKYQLKYNQLIGGAAAGPRPTMTTVKIIRGLKSQDMAHRYKGSGKKIGILIAGNAGRPAGGLGKPDGTGLSSDFRTSFETQEEDVVASWLQAEEHRWNQRNRGVPFNVDQVFRDNLGVNVWGGRPWGMLYPDKQIGTRTSYHTIQGKNFTHKFFDQKGVRMDQTENYNFAYSLQNKPISNTSKNSIKMTDLVFVYGPNVSYRGQTSKSTGTRTLVEDYQYPRDYPVFRESVKTALRAGLLEMYRNGNKIAILARISGGIYSGGRRNPTNVQINSEFESIINEILNEDIPWLANVKIGSVFEEVILPLK
jgi:hypothetical protein